MKKFFELKKDIYIGIVEKAQETSSDTGMHDTVCLCHYCTSRTVDVSWNAEKHPHQVTIII